MRCTRPAADEASCGRRCRRDRGAGAPTSLPSSGSVCGLGNVVVTASSVPTARKEMASAASAVAVPAPATTSPPIAGPPAAPAVKAMLSSAFPSRSCPAGASTAAAEARVSALAADAIDPSRTAIAKTTARTKSCASNARAPNATASAAYRLGRVSRAGRFSSRATIGGPSSAGRKCMMQNSPHPVAGHATTERIQPLISSSVSAPIPPAEAPWRAHPGHASTAL